MQGNFPMKLEIQVLISSLNELQHNKTNKMTCVPSEDTDQPGHPPSLMSLRCALGG